MRQLSDQTSRLARQEVELAKAELTDKGRTLGIGLGEFGAAGLIAVLALGALTATLILALSEAVDDWLAALIVTVVYLAVAGLLALGGQAQGRGGDTTSARTSAGERQAGRDRDQARREGGTGMSETDERRRSPRTDRGRHRGDAQAARRYGRGAG